MRFELKNIIDFKVWESFNNYIETVDNDINNKLEGMYEELNDKYNNIIQSVDNDINDKLENMYKELNDRYNNIVSVFNEVEIVLLGGYLLKN